jgi:nucleoside triphosphatase
MPAQAFPEPTVGVLIFNPRGELLLLQSHKWRGKYVVPGGHIELGESAVEAVRRETREETGLEVDDIRFLCWQEFIYDELFWKPGHFIFLDYTCKTDDSQVVLNDEAEAFLWAEPRGALAQLDLDPYTAKAIRQYLERGQEAS